MSGRDLLYLGLLLLLGLVLAGIIALLGPSAPQVAAPSTESPAPSASPAPASPAPASPAPAEEPSTAPAPSPAPTGAEAPTGPPAVALGSTGPMIMTPEATNAAVSIALSQAAFPDNSATAAVLARDDTYAYAIATGGLQGKLGGPLLLTNPQQLSAGLIDELRRLGAETVYLFGDATTISSDVEREITAAGFATVRIGGSDQVQTAIEAARQVAPDATTALVLGGFDLPGDSGRGYVDALAAGAWAATAQAPVLLTDPLELSAQTRAYIGQSAIERVMIVGGTVAVSDQVRTALEDLGIIVERVGGQNRFDTAAQVAGLWDGTRKGYVLIDGNSDRLWAAGFAAASYAMRAEAPVLLADSGTLPGETRALLSQQPTTVQLICAPGVEDGTCTSAQEISAAAGG